MFRARHPVIKTSISPQQESCAAAKLPPVAEKTHATFCIRKIFYSKIFTDVNMRISFLIYPLGIDPQAHTHTYKYTVHMHRQSLWLEEELNLRAYLPFLPTLALGFRYQSCPVLPGLCNFQINKSLVTPAWGLISGCCCCCFCLFMGVYHHSHHIHIKPHQQQLAGLRRLAALTVGN